jgi:WD40 repeat protein
VILELGEKPRILFSKSWNAGVNGVAFGPEGLIAAAGGDGSVRVLDQDGTVLARMTGHEGPVADVTFLGRDLVVSTGVDGSTRAWAWAQAAEPTLQAAPLPSTGGVAFVPGNVGIVAADGSASTWKPSDPTARPLLPADPGGADQAAISPDGRFVATTSPDGILLVRDRSGAQVGRWALGHTASQIAWLRSDSGLAAALLGGDVRTVALKHGSSPETLGTHAEDALAVTARSSDGAIASGGRDGVIRLWDGTKGGQLVADLDAQINALAFDPAGRYLAAAVGDQTVRIYDVEAQDPPKTLRGRFGETYDVAFGEGSELVTGGERGLRIWDWRRAVILLTVPRAQGAVALAVTGPEPTVASYGYDNVVHVTTCDVCGSISDVKGLLARRTTRPLTAGERTDFQVGG